MNDAAITARLLPHMPFVSRYDETLRGLSHWWQKVALIGKINSLEIAATLLDDMEATKQRFEELQRNLLANLVAQNVRKLDQEIGARAQVAIDILVRNLFERTADVGFLATDEDIRTFLRRPAPEPAAQRAIVERLREYTRKYSVYDEILLLDPQGNVRAHLDPDNPVSRSVDPLIAETLACPEPYLETFRASDLQQGRPTALIYSARINDSDDPRAAVLGILCLCFRFDDEMDGIFANLVRPGESVAVLDRSGTVIASSAPKQLAAGVRLSGRRPLSVMHHGDGDYAARTAPTKGYQGYFGLGWQGHAMRTLGSAFAVDGEESGFDEALLSASRCIGDDVRRIGRNAALVTDDLTLVVLNGQIISAKRDAKEFMPVLDEIRSIGQRTKDVFDQSINRLYATVLGSLLSEVRFQAFLAVDIMDRNLYERANDVRWWALTSRFREILAQPRRSSEDSAELGRILGYINGLYTVYTNLLLFDAGGRVVAVSQEKERGLVGAILPDAPHVGAALAVHDSQSYVVSPFEATPLYGGRHSYVYCTSVRAPDAGARVVGGIAIVFDAEPEFAAMLEDALPRDERDQPLEGAFGAFVERDGRIIACTHPELRPGQRLAVEPRLLALENGQRDSKVCEWQGRHYAVGAAMSQGYREYKTSGDYDNDVLALIFVPI